MRDSTDVHLSRRERQIMDIIYAFGKASATEVLRQIPDPPTRTTVRTMLRILEQKGHLKHTKRGREFIYSTTRPRTHAARSALKRVLQTFFEGSLEKAFAVHLSDPKSEISDDDLKRLVSLVREARKKRR